MKLPQHIFEALFFSFSTSEELLSAISNTSLEIEKNEIVKLANLGLPPVTSVDTLSAIIGVNPGIIWSFLNRPKRHYRIFPIKKGKGERIIAAPRVGLKIIQTWIGFHLSRAISLPPHVFGFIPGISHIDAAFVHRGAQWAYSVDIADFFGTTPLAPVSRGLISHGYSHDAAKIIFGLSSLNGFLTQGSPASPTLSNLAFLELDEQLARLASKYNTQLTRYADDIVFSGQGQLPEGLMADVHAAFLDTPWTLAADKERVEPFKGRIKVHGIIVNGEHPRLTKGYRNKIRAYRHILNKGGAISDHHVLNGHVRYADHVSKRLKTLQDNPPPPILYEKYNSIEPISFNPPLFTPEPEKSKRRRFFKIFNFLR